MRFDPISNKRASEVVVEEIKKVIFSGSIEPGEKLPPERELAQQFNVGRPVIRESLRILELSGLVYIKRGVDGGAFIEKIGNFNFANHLSDLYRHGRVSIEQLTEARLMIENDVLELIAKKASKNSYRLLDDIINSAYTKLKGGEKIRRENFLFHIVLAETSENPLLTMIANSIMPVISIFVDKLNPSPEHSRTILESHKSILDEMKQGNLLGAKEKMKEHILFFFREFKTLGPKGTIELDETVYPIAKIL